MQENIKRKLLAKYFVHDKGISLIPMQIIKLGRPFRSFCTENLTNLITNTVLLLKECSMHVK